MKTNIKPRNDYVLIRVINLGKTSTGILVSDQSQEGKEYIIEAVGPDVEDLAVGEKVLMVGTLGEDYAYIPSHPDLLIIKQANIILIFGEDNEEIDPSEVVG